MYLSLLSFLIFPYLFFIRCQKLIKLYKSYSFFNVPSFEYFIYIDYFLLLYLSLYDTPKA
ncbi:hypothetical protein BE25_0151 [Staphylococcus phage vB_SepM_BE25]|nr:hypothetical protein BE24_0120 [Staphylococcus phage vB_SepM_BE24]WEU70637.1 hypothetical protein BE25_0151 [Staphylococcus phage vB_SepM_BE25]